MYEAKAAVRDFWEAEPCGSRYGDSADRREFFRQVSDERYRIEPYILTFADFASAKGKDVLEIGLGTGADFIQWTKHARHATGVDITSNAVRTTRERLEAFEVAPSLYTVQEGDAEALPFPDDTFDLVYSYGVLHHTPDTPQAFAEAFRVLRPGGVLKAMVYQPFSWVALMLWVQHGLLKGRAMTLRQALFDHLESPGTKSYTPREARELLAGIGFGGIDARTHLSPGDTLDIKPSAKYRALAFIWKVYPRWLVRLLGHRFGTHLLIEARKP